jgi:nucleotide-binding universal stress UspA family protein
MYKHILIATDGSKLSAIAIEGALSLAHALGSKVTILTVIEPFRLLSVESEQIARTRDEFDRYARDEAGAHLAEAERRAHAMGVPCELVQVKNDHPYEAIIAAARAGKCDLIAMASHGRSGVSAVVLGSETAKVLTHSRIPVLVFR